MPVARPQKRIGTKRIVMEECFGQDVLAISGAENPMGMGHCHFRNTLASASGFVGLIDGWAQRANIPSCLGAWFQSIRSCIKKR